MSTTQMIETLNKTQFLCEALVEQLNEKWKVDSIESGHAGYHQLEIEEGRKYIKFWEIYKTANNNHARSCWMFVEKETGFCYKPASCKAPAKGVRFGIHQLVNYPETCDPFGSFLYLR
jgi:hypothetical protein